ncbi:MAG: hypothetical protein HQM08_12025 [Candidatus Riflebacteria bacterium]|nr:hypothetical protein [Candidatus Riflebacteria bacterium]
MNQSKLFFILAIFLSLTFYSTAFSAVQKEWTVAVFLNADNNLDQFGVEDQTEMAKVGSNDWLNVVTLIARQSGPAVYNYIENGKITRIPGTPAVKLDMGDYRTLINFAKWVVANYPAKKYALVIWNHGSGWKKGKVTRGISYDDSTNNYIKTNELGVALNEIKTAIGHNLDILDMDACLMQMAEVAYECLNKVDFIVASEEVEPGKGTPYDDVLNSLSKDSAPEDFAKAWVKAYGASYNHGSQGDESCTQSCIKVSELGVVYDAMNGLVKSAMSGKFNDGFSKALKSVKKFEDSDNIDLIHFAQLLKGLIPDESIKTASDKLIAASQNAVIACSNIGQENVNAFGLAAYFPIAQPTFDDNYKNLDFSAAVKWEGMILDYYNKNKADSVITNASNGNVTALKAYVAGADPKNKKLNRFVAQKINFELNSGKKLPRSVVAETNELVRTLLAK